MAFACQICFEDFAESSRLELTPLHTGNGDVIRAADCEHPVCRSCLAQHVRVRIEEQRVNRLPCPMPGCQVELHERDLRRLAPELDETLCERFVELRSRDFGARAQSFEDMEPRSREDVELLLCLHEMRRCPRCKLLMQRSSGCNSFYCLCGEHFNYAAAERAVGTGVKHFKWVLELAVGQRIGLRESMLFGGDLRLFKKCSRTAQLLALHRSEALDLHRKAGQGDEEAKRRIREARSAVPRPALETRVANDGVAYSREAFIRHYGRRNGRWWWEACAWRAMKPTPDAAEALLVPLRLGDKAAWVPLQQIIACEWPCPARLGAASKLLPGSWRLRLPQSRERRRRARC